MEILGDGRSRTSPGPKMKIRRLVTSEGDLGDPDREVMVEAEGDDVCFGCGPERCNQKFRTAA